MGTVLHTLAFWAGRLWCKSAFHSGPVVVLWYRLLSLSRLYLRSCSSVVYSEWARWWMSWKPAAYGMRSSVKKKTLAERGPFSSVLALLPPPLRRAPTPIMSYVPPFSSGEWGIYHKLQPWDKWSCLYSQHLQIMFVFPVKMKSILPLPERESQEELAWLAKELGVSYFTSRSCSQRASGLWIFSKIHWLPKGNTIRILYGRIW